MKLHLLSGMTKVALVGALIFSALVSFFAYRSSDAVIPFGLSHAFSILKVNGDITDGEAAQLLGEAASRASVNILKVAPFEHGGDLSRALFAFVGNPDRFTDRYGDRTYPQFDPGSRTVFQSMDSLPNQDLRGLYFIDGNDSALRSVVHGLTSRGIDATSETIDGQFVVHQVVDELGLIPIGGSIALFLALAFVVGAMQAQKHHALAVLHGRSEWHSLAAEIRDLSIFGTSAGILMAVVSVGALYLINGLAQFSTYIVWLAVALASTLAVCIAVHVVAFLLTPAYSPLDVVRGRRPMGFVATTAALCQIAALALALTTVSTLCDTNASASVGGPGQWEGSSDLVAVRASQSLATESRDEVTARFGRFYADARTRAGSVLAYGSPSAQEGDGYAPLSGNSIVANPEFLRHEAIRDTRGERIGPADVDPGLVTLLVPARLTSATASLIAQYTEFVRFQQAIDAKASKPREPQVVARQIADGQAAFNFTDGSFGPTKQQDAVIAVIPFAAEVLSDDFYLAASSTQNLLFSSASTLRTQIRTHAISDLLVGIYRPSDAAARVEAAAVRRSRALLTGAILSILILMFSSLVSGASYVQARRHQILVQRIHGWTFVRMHAELLLIAGGTAGAVLAILTSTGNIAPAAFPLSLGLACSSVTVLSFVVASIQGQRFTVFHQ